MLDLSALDTDGAAGHGGTQPNGAPLLLAIDAIDEDPTQPRTEFAEDALQELAETIRARGVRQPISVRTHPTQPGRWMLNFGARRLRASKLAGRSDVPAFIDETVDSYDQVIENEQRESLKPLELALFIQRRMKAGESQAEIARRLGKSRTYITYASALIDAPDWLTDVYRHGRCRGLAELYELRRLHAANGERIEHWARDREAISRTDLAELKMSLEPKGAPKHAHGPEGPDRLGSIAPMNVMQEPANAIGPAATSAAAGRSRQTTSGTRKCPVLLAQHHEQVVEVVFDTIPDQDGSVYVRPQGGGERHLVIAQELKLLRLVAA